MVIRFSIAFVDFQHQTFHDKKKYPSPVLSMSSGVGEADVDKKRRNGSRKIAKINTFDTFWSVEE